MATAVADPLLAADAAAAEAAEKDAPEPTAAPNGDRTSSDAKTESKVDSKADSTGPLPVTTATKPPAKPSTKPSTRSAKRAKAAKKAATGTTAAAATKTAVVDDELPPTQAVEAVVADASTETAVQPTPSNGVPMVALVPPGALTEPTPVIDTPTTTSPTVVAPTAAAVAAATVAVPAVVTPQKQAKAPKPAASPKGQKVAAAPRRRVRARRVQRIVRRVDAWSVMKISFIFFIVMYLVLLVAGVLLWAFAVGTGTIDNVENFIEQLFALDSFSFVGEQILRASVAAGAILVVAGTFTTTVLAVLFNLISDLVGGVRFTVVEEQVLRPVAPKPSPAATPATASPSASVDGSVDGSAASPGTV